MREIQSGKAPRQFGALCEEILETKESVLVRRHSEHRCVMVHPQVYKNMVEEIKMHRSGLEAEMKMYEDTLSEIEQEEREEWGDL